MSLLQRPKTSNQEVYAVTLVALDGQEHIVQYRGPSRSEIMVSQSLARGDMYTYYEELIKKCTISPVIVFDTETIKENEDGFLIADLFRAGEIYFLGIEIEKCSGLADPNHQKRLNALADEYIVSDTGKLDCLAFAVLPGLNPLELFEAPPEVLYKVWKIAETLAAANGVDSRIFLDPESYMKDMKKQEQEIVMKQKLAEAEELAAAANSRGKRRQRLQSTQVSV